MTKSHQDQVYFRLRNWGRFQSKSKAQCHWSKLHHSILDNADLERLTHSQQLVAYKLIPLFGRIGKPLPWDCGYIRRALRSDSRRIGSALEALKSIGFIELCESTSDLWGPTEKNKSRVDKNTLATLGTSPDGEPPGKEFDPAKQLFDFGVQLLASYGIKNQKARALIGKWRKVRNDPDLMAILLRAGETRRFEIVPFVEGSLRDQVQRPKGFADREREAHSERMKILAEIGGYTNGQSGPEPDNSNPLHRIPGGSPGAASLGNIPKGGRGPDRGD